MSRPRPVIGITTYGRQDHAVDNPLFGDHYSLPSIFADAVRRAGGVPVLLPPGGEDSEDWFGIVDGFILTGGADVAPAFYGGDQVHPALQPPSVDRDAAEAALITALMERENTPVLFICRGMQLLNATLGGGLHMHIPDLGRPDIHRSADGGWILQPVDIEKESRLYGIMATAYVETWSGHHQAVSEIAPALTPVAFAKDGIVEALEIPTRPYFIAVQWHPEVSAATDPSQQALFDGLVRACRAG